MTCDWKPDISRYDPCLRAPDGPRCQGCGTVVEDGQFVHECADGSWNYKLTRQPNGRSFHFRMTTRR